MLSDLRYSARSLARTSGLTVALVLTIALGIGSNAAVHGFIRGLLSRSLPIANIDTVVSIALSALDGPAGPVSFDDYSSIKASAEVFEWVGAARESQATLVVDGRSTIMPVAAVTPELAALLQLSPAEGVVISHRLRQGGLRPTDTDHGTLRIDGHDTHVAAVAPEWLDGVYLGRPVDVWLPWRAASLADDERSSRSIWVIARLRTGVTIRQAEALINAGRQDAGGIRVFPYTGLTPEMAGGLSRIGTLLRAAAAAVFCHRLRQRRLPAAWRARRRDREKQPCASHSVRAGRNSPGSSCRTAS